MHARRVRHVRVFHLVSCYFVLPVVEKTRRTTSYPKIFTARPALARSILKHSLNSKAESGEPRYRIQGCKRVLDSAQRPKFPAHGRKIPAPFGNTDVPILILGESGVGKEVMARFAHRHSGRADKPFVKVNCAALPHELLESELFGYERGAFTGAAADKTGKFEQAHTGTLLLDEIGEMSSHLQSKLLHILQDGEFSRLGSRKTTKVDVRIIAATNIKLEESIGQGSFREDLYYRLNVVRIDLPPLRERPEDIPELCDHFLGLYAEKYHSDISAIPGSLMQCFANYDWPGNIRELENVVKRFLVLGHWEDIANELSPRIQQAPPNAAVAAESQDSQSSLLHVGAAAADDAQRQLVVKVLGETHGNRKEAARRLNISYKALLNKLKRWKAEDAGSGVALTEEELLQHSS